MLSRLAKSEYVDESLFKGGTSLLKEYNLIDRFSEDVHIARSDHRKIRSHSHHLPHLRNPKTYQRAAIRKHQTALPCADERGCGEYKNANSNQ